MIVAMTRTAFSIGICWISLFAGPAMAQDAVSGDAGTLIEGVAAKLFPAKPPYSPYAGLNFPTRPLFGDRSCPIVGGNWFLA